MSKLRTVTLEFLRHGPPHNQLLSPLTQYLALCGNHSAASVTMPFEHNQLLIRLNALLYKDHPETIKLQLKDTAQIMAGVLGEVPGLIAELADSSGPDAPLTHLRLILSASELALLPFELANAPNGFPGAGQPLALQAQAPICITREIRRVGNTHFKWPDQPRILFIAASPPGVGDIPLEEHLLALRTVIDPWVEDYERKADLKKTLDPHLVVLPQASVASIQEKCAQYSFTHIHILAHGLKLPGEEEKRYGLALHNDWNPDEPDIVDGSRLATLLRTYSKRGLNALSTPAVVTLASCDSGQQGSVVGAGASVAHALHEGGIPLVVASQFPVSFSASVLMTQVLYEGLLWGVDPRILLNDLRWQLKSKLPDTHDWASMVAYAALPTDLRSQLLDMRIVQAHRSITAALKFMDQVTAAMLRESEKTKRGTGDSKFSDEVNKEKERALVKKENAVERMKDILREAHELKPHQCALIYGLLASTAKRDAKILFGSIKLSTGSAAAPQAGIEGVTRSLEIARESYAKAFKADRTETWALVQEMSLTAVLEGPSAINPEAWTVARELSERDLYAQDRARSAWAYGNLIELYLLAVLLPSVCSPSDAKKKALDYAERLTKLPERSLEVYTTRRQIERYTDWFKDYEQLGKLVPLAHEILNVLPFNPRFK